MRKSGSAVFLMELVVVVLFFSLAATVTLRLFVAAYETDRASGYTSAALERAEDAAELFRAGGQAAFAQWTARDGTGGGRLYALEEADSPYRLEAELHTRREAAGQMETGELRVYDRDEPDTPLCVLPLARYTPRPGGTDGNS